MKKINNKNYKIIQLQKIKQSYKYFYFFCYNNITTNEIISLKKKLKKININTLIIKKNFISKDLMPLNTQGCILIIYTNNYINLIKNLILVKKMDFLYFLNDNNFYSKAKYTKMLLNANKNLNILLLTPLNLLYNNLKKIQKVNIT